jgi:signal transduction histidine kinase
VKIRQRLALRFTIVSALLTGAILILIYAVTQRFVHADFAERLVQQSRFEALHYESPGVKDVIPEGSFQLVNPSVAIYNEKGELLYTKGDYNVEPGWVKYLQSHTIFNAERGDYTTVGRRYFFNNMHLLVFVSDKDLPGQHELDLLIKAIVIGWGLSLLFSYLAGLYFSGDAIRPVKHVVNEVKGITKDNLGYRLKFNRDNASMDEIDELIVTFNALLARIETAFVAQKRFVQHASHELKTPLTAILAEAELALARDRDAENYKRTLSVIVSEAERLVTATHGLLTLARLEEGSFVFQPDVVEIKDLIRNTVQSFKLHHPDRSLVLEGELPSVSVHGSNELLQLALLNILNNSVKYSKDKIIMRVVVPPDSVTVEVEDFGIGVPSAELDRIRSPLFRGSNVGNVSGAGLGLSLVERVMRIHKGEFKLHSIEGKGTVCGLTLPLVRR